jgi:hypothetical protein
MRAHIREHVLGARLRDTVPPLYREDIAKGTIPGGLYTAILCSHNPRDVVTSSTLHKAFKRLENPAQNGIIIVGSAFTEEAIIIAAQHQARIAALHKATWTDQTANQRHL